MLFLSASAALPAREWNDAAGRKLEGDMLGIEKDCAVVQLPNKQRACLPLAQLSPADQAWTLEWARDKSPSQRLPLPLWRETVQQPEIKLGNGARRDGGFVFTSPHYEFTCDAEVSASVMNDFATVAEGTVRLLYSLPLQLGPLDGRTYTARICRSRATYERAGGLPGSAGVFITASMSGEGLLLVPFESLGIEQFAGKNTKGYDYRATVLIHEMAHQVVGELLPLMPKWVAEGLAEYSGNMTYRNGVFFLGPRDRTQMLRQRLDFYDRLTREQETRVMASPSSKPGSGGAPPSARLPESWIMRPGELLRQPEGAWATNVGGRAGQIQLHQMYLSSMFLMHYFLHLADNGEARRIRLYFEKMAHDAAWFRTMGRDGSPPPEFITRRTSMEDIRDHYLKVLVTPDQLAALDADFRAKYIGLGFRIPEWK
jgi:hypothetical protein